MALEKITASLVAKFNRNTAAMEYYLIPTNHTWWVGETDVIVKEEQVFVVDIPTLSKEEFTLKAIQTLREKQKKAYDEAAQTAARLEEKIKELQLLTWQADPSVIDSQDIILQSLEDALEDTEALADEVEENNLDEDDSEEYYTELQETAYNDFNNKEDFH